VRAQQIRSDLSRISDVPGFVIQIDVGADWQISIVAIGHKVCLPIDSEIVCGQEALNLGGTAQVGETLASDRHRNKRLLRRSRTLAA